MENISSICNEAATLAGCVNGKSASVSGSKKSAWGIVRSGFLPEDRGFSFLSTKDPIFE